MSDHLPDPEHPGRSPLDDVRAAEDPTVTQTLATPSDGPGWLASDDAGDSDEEWVSQTTRGFRLGVPAAALIALVLIAGGFWAGSALEKSHGGSSTSASALAGVAARFRSAAGGLGATATAGAAASRFGGLFGGAGAAAGTAGTISVVNGNTLYVDDTATGSIVKVTLTKSTTITRNADAAAIDLRPGDTVTVQGATGSSGTVTATSVSATAPGVSSGFGGFGRGLGTGATTGAGAGTTGSNTTTTPALFGGG
jgi:hypothetical protein